MQRTKNRGTAIAVGATSLILLGYSIITMMTLPGCGGGGIDKVDSGQFIMSLSATPDYMAPEEYGTITCTLEHRTANSNQIEPVPKHEVSFAIVQNTTGAKLTPVNPVTDNNGKATCIYQAGTKEGIDIVQATIPEGVMTRVSIIVQQVTTTTTTTTMPPVSTTTTTMPPVSTTAE